MPASLRLLGVPHIDDEGGAHRLPVSKATCLLVFLAVRAEWVRRDEVMLMLWPDGGEARARHALRQLLYRARAFAWAQRLETADGALRWQVVDDVRRFRERHAAGDWSAAVAAYGGSFLTGFAVSDAPGFDAWRDQVRSELHERYLQASLRAAAASEMRRAYRDAIATLRTAQARDPTSEDVLHALLRCLAASGERSAAEACFARFEASLATHLDARPSDATRALVERIRRGDALAAPAHNLPAQTTVFVGREAELEDIARRLRRPECRLLTLVGPGGTGKTRLALRCAEDHVGAYRDGVFQVPLNDVATVDGVVFAIAEALGRSLPARGDPWSDLGRHLYDREHLLVLDGMEHLLHTAGRLATLLTQAPGLTALVTSREPLGLTLEWLVPVGGLDRPGDDDACDVSSMRLFADAANRASPSFDRHAGDLHGAARVCRLVAGVPLAIELAAAWTPVLSPTEIADAIAHDLDLLEGTASDRPPRQRGFRTVFEASWASLGETERETLVRSAVFAGDADVMAIRAVAEASLPAILALVRRSLLLCTDGDRFAMHPLVRPYARERLASNARLADAVRTRHVRYYADEVARWSYGCAPNEVGASLARDLADVEQAWRYALALGEWHALRSMLASVALAHDVTARHDRLLRWLDDALTALAARPRPDELYARVQERRVACLHRLGGAAPAARGRDAQRTMTR